MKNQLYAKCKVCDFEKLFAKKGYSYFTKGNYNLNIIDTVIVSSINII